MTQFKRVITHLLRVPQKFRRPTGAMMTQRNVVIGRADCDLRPELRQRCEVTPTANAAVTYGEPNEPREPAPLLLEPKVPPLTDAITEEVERDEEDECEEDEDVPETFPFDLTRKAQVEMMVHHIYVAVTDNDREIAALRTHQGEEFTQIVQVAFEPVPTTDDNIAPSSWSWQAGPHELRLTCPILARLGDGETALSAKQLRAARNYIYFALPDGDREWEKAGIEIPSWRENCQDAKLLIVGPPDRLVDVMAILVSYLAFLTGEDARKLLKALRRLKLVHKLWRDQILGEATLQLADTVAEYE